MDGALIRVMSTIMDHITMGSASMYHMVLLLVSLTALSRLPFLFKLHPTAKGLEKLGYTKRVYLSLCVSSMCCYVCSVWSGACAHLSLDRGLGSGRRTIRALPARVAGGDLGKLVSREPDFLCRGSSPMAPAISLSIGQEPARPCDAIGQEPERAWW